MLVPLVVAVLLLLLPLLQLVPPPPLPLLLLPPLLLLCARVRGRGSRVSTFPHRSLTSLCPSSLVITHTSIHACLFACVRPDTIALNGATDGTVLESSGGGSGASSGVAGSSAGGGSSPESVYVGGVALVASAACAFRFLIVSIFYPSVDGDPPLCIHPAV